MLKRNIDVLSLYKQLDPSKRMKTVLKNKPTQNKAKSLSERNFPSGNKTENTSAETLHAEKKLEVFESLFSSEHLRTQKFFRPSNDALTDV